MWYNDIIIWYIVWNNEPHQISDGWRSGMFEDTAAGQGGETESADWQTEEEYWEGVGQVRGHRQVVLQPEVDQDRADQESQGVQLQMDMSTLNISLESD